MAALRGLGAVLLLATASGAGAQNVPDGAAQTPPDLPSRTIESPRDATPMAKAPVLTVDQDLLFTDSNWGKRTQRVLDETGGRIAAENERLAARLSAEEATLTQQRGTLDPAEFRKQAEAFDTRATEVRRERAQVVQDLNAWAAADRAAFYRAAQPLMARMMQERGAVAVLDRRTVFVSLDAIDLTQALVARLDAELGDGAGQVPLQEPDSSD